MSKKVLIIHGWGGSPTPHWQSQLEDALLKDNYEVSFPTLPNLHFPILNEWKEYIKKEVEVFQPQIVVCHSLGNIVWLHLIQELDIQLEKLLLVAPVRYDCNIKEVETFFPYPYPKDLKAKDVSLVASSNDPYMNQDEVKEFKNKFNIKLEVFNNAGHINADSGFGRFDFAYDFVTKEEV